MLDPAPLNRYPGGKGGAGVYQAIINCIPRHSIYVEPFAGSAAIYRRKKPAPEASCLVELNPAIADRLRHSLKGPSTTVICGDGIRYMRVVVGLVDRLSGWFFYIDPPYLHSTRRDLDLYGDFELTDDQHRELLASLLPALSAAGALWALSGYRSPMYDAAAASSGWHRTDYRAMTRRGPVIESLWTNFEPGELVPAELTFTGATYRERERIKRKASRWAMKYSQLPMLERRFILEAMLASTGADDDGRRA